MTSDEKTVGRNDVTELHRKYEELRQIKDELERVEAMYRFLAENSLDAIWRLDAKFQFEYVSPAANTIFGYQVEEIIGRSLFSILTPKSINKVRQEYAKREYLMKAGKKWGGSVFTVKAIHKDGYHICVEVTVNPIFSVENRLIGYTGVTRDISERRKKEEAIYQYAFYDQLTTLPNRRMLHVVLEQEITQNIETGNAFAVLFLDIDGFKEINDVYGHAAGDSLLQIIAERIRSAVRKNDFVARLAGDEFIAILLGMGDNDAASLIVTRMIEHCQQPIVVAENNVRVSISIGLSFFPMDADNITNLISFADQAMYRAKKSGGGKYVCYGRRYN